MAQLLAERRQARTRCRPPPLIEQQILSWADAHHRRTHRWPTASSGPIPEAPGDTWNAVDRALYQGGRGLPGGTSLYRLLEQERHACSTNHKHSKLAIPQILLWADARLSEDRRLAHSRFGPYSRDPR